MHSLHVVHRDLKPENLLLSRDAQLKVVDFGIAKLSQGLDLRTFCGTIEYLAPEVIQSMNYGKE